MNCALPHRQPTGQLCGQAGTAWSHAAIRDCRPSCPTASPHNPGSAPGSTPGPQCRPPLPAASPSSPDCPSGPHLVHNAGGHGRQPHRTAQTAPLNSHTPGPQCRPPWPAASLSSPEGPPLPPPRTHQVHNVVQSHHVQVHIRVVGHQRDQEALELRPLDAPRGINVVNAERNCRWAGSGGLVGCRQRLVHAV